MLAQVGHETAAAAADGGSLRGLVGAIVLLPLLGSVLAGLCAAMRVKSKLPAWLSVGCIGAAFICTVMLYLQSGHGTSVVHLFDWINFKWGTGGKAGAAQELVANFSFYIDSLTLLWMLFVTGLATLIALYASEYMSGDLGAGYCRFFAAFCLFVFAMSCLVMGDNLILLYLGWEGVGLCSYLLIGYFYKKPSAVAAAKKAFIVNRIGDLGLAIGIWLTFTKFGTVEYAKLFPLIEPYLALAKAGAWEQIPLTVQLIPVLFTVGAFGKSAQIPLYVWLPDAMEGPTPVSALIHAATMVTAGVYLVARWFPLFHASEYALPIVAWGGTLTALLAATIGMAQFDIKRIMAYSTVSQLGYMFAGLGVMSSVAGASHVFTHAFFKALLFLACGAVMHGFAGQLDLRKLSGLNKMPGWKIVSLTMLVGCINLAGVPFVTAGFYSKDMILGDAFANHKAAIGWILLITAGLTAYYTFRVYFRVFVGPAHYEPGDEHHVDAADEAVEAERAHAHDHDHGHGHGEFHPHAPGWAINLVLTVLAVAAFAVIPLVAPHDSWAREMVNHSTALSVTEAEHAAPMGVVVTPREHGDPAPYDQATKPTHIEVPEGHALAQGAHAAHAHGTFLGFPAHGAMKVVSGIVALIGIAVAWRLHYAGRTTAARAKADDLLPLLGPIPRWAQNKWYVDELYHAIIVLPLRVIAHLCHLFDKILIDGVVNLAGWAPRGVGSSIRPAQSGVLHDYALRMLSGVGVVLLIVLIILGGRA